jgi:hypothetical protein
MNLKKILFFSSVLVSLFLNVYSMETPSDGSQLEIEWLTAFADTRKKKIIFNKTQGAIDYENAEVFNKKYPSERTSYLKQATFDIVMQSCEFKDYSAAKEREIALRKKLNL